MDLKGKSLLILAIFVFLIGAVSAEELNDTVAIENGDLSESDTLETISVDEDVENTSIENNFEVVETNNLENESNEVSSIATPSAQTFDGIQTIIDSASAGDTIKLTGTYIGSGTQITLNKNLNFVGENQATLDAKTLNRIIYINGDYTVTFTNITFKNGKVSGSGTNGDGGAVYINMGVVNFTGCNFINNIATINGGAIYLINGGTASFTNCDLINNTANSYGAICISGGCAANFTGCNFINNTATNNGGAIIIAADALSYFTGCNFINNTANQKGGAIYINDGDGNFTNCNFRGNVAGNGGGAVFIQSSSASNFTNCNFTGNVADNGGAVFMAGNGYFTNCNFNNNTANSGAGAVYIAANGYFTNCNFNNNTANSGGAVFIEVNGYFTNCNFNNNTANGGGGAIFAYYNGSINFTNCNFTNNTAYNNYGGAVYLSIGAMNFTNCNFRGNTNSMRTIYINGDANFNDCNFTNNSAKDSGGAISIIGNGYFIDCNFIGNIAGVGGGAVFVTGNGYFIDCNFTDNTASYSNGGAVFIQSDSASNFTRCNFIDNTAIEGSAVYIGGNSYFTDCDFKDNVTDKTKSVIYMLTTNSRLWLDGNAIVTNSTPIYINQGIITSSIVLVVLNNQTVKSPANTQVNLTAGLYDDNGNIIGSNTAITLNIVGLASSLTASFNRDNLNYSVAYTPTVGGVYTVTGTVPKSVADNVTEYKNGTLITGITTLSVDLLANNTNPAIGDLIQYTITIKNTGAYKANSITVEDILDTSKLEYISCSPAGAYNPNTGVLVVENLDINQESSLNITVRVKSIGEINNTVTVQSQQIMDDITRNLTIVASKKTPDMVVDLLNNTKDNVTVKVSVPKDATGNVTIDINGTKQNKIIENGTVVMEFNDIKPGKYNMTVTYGGNDEYDSLTEFKEFIVKEDLNPDDIQTEILNNTYGNTTVRISVPLDATGNITLNINGQSFTQTISNGVVKLKLSNIPPGNYTVNVTYSGDDNYNPISKLMDLEVIKANITNIDTAILNNTYGNTTVKVTVPKGVNGNITINVNGQNHTGPINDDGEAIIKLTNVTAGNHIMTITYGGNKYYNSKVVNEDLEVVKSTINPNDINITIINNTYGSTCVNVSVPKDATGNVTINVNGQNYTGIIHNGVATVDLGNVTAGNHTMNITYNGDNNYKSVSKEDDLEVVKANIGNLTTIVVNNTYGNVTIQVKVSENVTGSITINVNGENHTETIDNGSVTIKIPDIAIGDYKMNVTYNGNENYNSLTTQEDLRVRLNLKPEQVTTDIINDTYGNVKLQVNVPYNVTGNVTINVGNKTFNANISNGVAIVNLTGVEAGNHTLDMNITYNGDENYNPLTKTESLEVKKANITMDIETLNNTYGNTTIKVTLPEDATGDVLIKVSNETYKGVIANGSATIKLNNVTAGNHTMTITYPGDNNYNSYTTEEDLEVVKAKINPDDMKVEIISNITDKVEVKVTVPENATGNITIKIGNETYTAPIKNGTATINITNITEGNYTMNVTYPGDDNFEPISKDVNLTVEPSPLIAIEMPITAINITYGELETIIVILPDNATGIVIFNVNGTDYPVNIEDSNLQGIDLDKQIKLDLNDLAAGIYNVTATYSGDSYYASIANSTTFEVKKAELNPEDLKVDIINNTAGNVTLNITVPEGVEGNITINVGNKTYNGTIENGSAIIKLPDVPVGNNTVEIVYNGDDNHDPIAKTENITVGKHILSPDNITTKVLNNTYGNTTIKVTVPENVTGNVTIAVNNKTYNGTIANGSAIVKLPDVPAGNHTITVTYNGDDNYEPIAKEENLEIVKNTLNPGDIKVTIINNTYGNTTVKIELPEDATGDITIAVGNKTHNATIANGSAIIKLSDVPAGNHTMTITYSGDNNYNQTTIEKELIIEKATINPDDIQIIVDEDEEGNTVIIIIAPPNFNGNITLEIGDKNYTVEVINGTGSLTIPKLPAGKYDIIIRFDGNDNFNGFTKYLTIEIKSDNTNEENSTSIANKEKLNNNTKISNPNSLENIKTANPILLLLLILLAVPLRRRKVD